MNALMKFLGEDDSDNGFVVCHYYRERYGTVKSRNGAILCGKR